VRGWRRCPSPPAMTMARTLDAISASFLLGKKQTSSSSL
jgi:hypothetical protein